MCIRNADAYADAYADGPMVMTVTGDQTFELRRDQRMPAFAARERTLRKIVKRMSNQANQKAQENK